MEIPRLELGLPEYQSGVLNHSTISPNKVRYQLSITLGPRCASYWVCGEQSNRNSTFYSQWFSKPPTGPPAYSPNWGLARYRTEFSSATNLRFTLKLQDPYKRRVTDSNPHGCYTFTVFKTANYSFRTLLILSDAPEGIEPSSREPKSRIIIRYTTGQ